MPFAALWQYRSFIAAMVGAEFRARFTGAVLGPLWAVLGPALLVATYLVVFAQVMRGRLPGAAEADGLDFALFLAIGIVSWGFFVDLVTRCQGMFLAHGGLIKKSAFPRLALPVAAALSAALNFAIVFAVLLAVQLAVGRLPGWGLLGLIPLLAIQQAIALGLGVLAGTLNVFFRDLGQILPLAINLWFWLTPIVYPRAIVPDWAQPILALNPLAPLFEGQQALFLTGSWDGWAGLWPPLALAVVLNLLGFLAFRRLAPAIADEL